MKTRFIASLFLAVSAIIALTSCQSLNPFKKNPPAQQAPAQNPNPPPPVVQAPPASASARSAKWTANSSEPNVFIKRMENRPAWYRWSVFDNLWIYKDGVNSGTGGRVLATNHRTKNERIAFQMSHGVLGEVVNDVESAIIIEPGESYSIKDPNLGSETSIRALIIDSNDVCLGYVPIIIKWKSGEVEWNITDSKATIELSGSRMISLPARSMNSGPMLSSPSVPPVPVSSQLSGP